MISTLMARKQSFLIRCGDSGTAEFLGRRFSLRRHVSLQPRVFHDVDCLHAIQYFPTTAVENIPNPLNLTLAWHGVNMAEGLKALPASYRFTHNQSGIVYRLFPFIAEVLTAISDDRSRYGKRGLGSALSVSWPPLGHLCRRRVSCRS